MSICIAAIASLGHTIVTASDRLFSWGNETSGDGRMKTQLIHGTWGAMLAGDDVRRLEPIIADTFASLKDIKKPTVDDVSGAVQRAWRDAQRQIIETEVLSPFGYDRPTFLARGRNELGDIKFNELVTEMAFHADLKCELLIYGFDEDGGAQLLALTGKGQVLDCTRLGFMAIGSGARTAIDALLMTKYRTETSWEEAVYRVCHAKFMSERAIGVGKNTMVVCLGRERRFAMWNNEAVKPIRDKWYRETRPTIPSDASSVVPKIAWNETVRLIKRPVPPRSTRGRKVRPPSQG